MKKYWFTISLTLCVALRAHADSSRVDALLTSDDQARHAAMEDLKNIDSTERRSLIPPLIKALKQTDDVDRRERAAEALTKFGPDAEAAIPALRQTLNDDLPYIRSRSAEALRAIGRAAVPAYIAMLGHSSGDVRAIGANALSDLGPEAAPAASALAERLGDSDSTVRDAAARALARMGDSGLDGLLQATQEGVSSKRLLAVRSLSSSVSKDSRLVERLAALLKDPDAQVRLASMKALVHKSPASIEPVTQMLGNENAAARESAAETLADIGRPAAQAVSSLITTLKDAEPAVRASSARALGKMGSKADPAIAELRIAAHDADATVAARAVEALTALAANNKQRMELASESSILGAPAAAAPALVKPMVFKSALKKPAPKRPAPKVTTPAQMKRWISQLTSTATVTGMVAYRNLVGANTRAVAGLTSALEKSTVSNRAAVIDILGEIGTPSRPAWPAIENEVHSDTAVVRASAVQALLRINGPSAVALFTDILKSTDTLARTTIVDHFSMWGSTEPSTVALVSDQLKDADKALQAAALGTLQALATPEATKAVQSYQKQQTLREANGFIRDLRKDPKIVNDEAVQALVKIGVPAVTGLSNALKDPAPIVREGAARALQGIGRNAAPAVPALTEALNDSQDPVRVASAHALEAIGTPEAKKPLMLFNIKEKVRGAAGAVSKHLGVF
jgi:HEAT repeat protein